MKNVDYLVVGLGIAGLSFCERLRQNGHSFATVDAGVSGATSVAGGVVNPVVLKRFTPAWNAQEFLPEAQAFYSDLCDHLSHSFMVTMPIWRIFDSVEEQNTWMVASQKEKLSPFLSSTWFANKHAHLKAPFGYGQLEGSFQIDTHLMLSLYRQYLDEKGMLLSETFDYSLLRWESSGVHYKDIASQKVVFCEGATAIQNPYFPVDCLLPKKGEYITVKAPGLDIRSIIKGPYFIIPLGNNLYKIGATFAHGDFSPETTKQGTETLVKAAEKIIGLDFTVVDQVAGFRPTVKDRRPLLGLHPNHSEMVFFNGLGTRGIMMAPLLSRLLYNHVQNGASLPDEVTIGRYFKA